MDNPPPHFAHGRRRVLRTGHGLGDDSIATTASSLQAGPSRLPELTQLVDVDFRDLDRDSDDLESDEHATPRIQPIKKLPHADNDLQTPAARLRALLSRVPNGSSPNATPVVTQATKSITTYESDSDMDISAHVNAAPSAAHTSIRNIFSNALRPPGDTPQKQRPRRNSIDTSEVETSPRVERAKHKSKRKSLSLSDEEVENSYRTAGRSPVFFKHKPPPSSLDVLRQRFMNSTDDEGSAPKDGYLSEDTADLLRELRASPPAATSTPQHSLQMSDVQVQSNLLDQDSEMQRAIGNADTYDFPSRFAEPANASESQQDLDFQSNSAPQGDSPSTPDKPPSPIRNSSQAAASTSRTPAPNHASTPSTVRHVKRLSGSPLDRAALPRSPRHSLHEAITGSLSRAGSLPTMSAKSPRTRVVSSPRPSDTSSRSSAFSQTDYMDRMADLDQDHARERERDWNRPNRISLSRRTSVVSLRSPSSSDRQRTQSLSTVSTVSNREPYQLPASVHQALRRHTSLTSDRQASPTNSANGSLEAENIIPLLVHERERNWMSPRPVWHVARVRTNSISSTGSEAEDDDDDNYNPPSTTARMTSPRSLAEIRSRIGQTIARTPESSPRTVDRFGASPREPVTSPSQKRLSSPSILSSPALRDLRTSPSASRTNISSRSRFSLSPAAKASSTSTSTGEQSTLRAPRRSLIPISPRKNKPVPVPVPAAQISVSSERQDTASDIDITEDGWAAQQNNGLGLHPPTNDDASLERTPTLKTIEPPSEGNLDINPSSGSLPEALTDNKQRPEATDSEGDAPYNSTPIDPSAHELPSFTATPPRHPSSISQSRVESPERSFDVPDLPGPPTDESEGEGPWDTPAPARLFPSAANTTAFKTPKPPGGWSDTPAPKRRSRAYSDSVSIQSSPLVPRPDPANWTAMQTPKPPGGWLATPTFKNVHYVDQSVETDTELDGFDSSAPEGEGPGSQSPQLFGLVTPVSSLSKGKYHDLQTPAAPGAWVQTPAARKSVMKVRFDPQPSDTREFATDTGDESTVSETAKTSHQPESLQTPPESPEMTPPSPKRKAPSIRVLDAYGNETREEDKLDFSSIKTPRRQPIRLVDTSGNSIEETSMDVAGQRSVDEEELVGENREEILFKVKQGLDQLVTEIHDLDRSSALLKSDLAHIKELDSVSLASREKRRRLVEQLRDANANVKAQVKSMNMGAPTDSQPTSQHVPLTYGFWSLGFLSLVFLQILLAGFLYHLYSSWSHDAFLTTYYDPYNPLIHLYTFKSQAVLPNLSKTTPWKSLLDLLCQQGLKAFGQKILDNLAVHVMQFQAFLWERWGEDMATQSAAWPPT